MNSIVKILLITVSGIGVIVCSIWLYIMPGFESISATVASVITFIGMFFINSGNDKGDFKMSQVSGKNSKLFQSARDMTINN